MVEVNILFQELLPYVYHDLILLSALSKSDKLVELQLTITC